jgi:alpha-D-xyloside xylohydrolase
MFMGERLKPYIKNFIKDAHEKGTPPMHPLFYDFPEDSKAWNMEDQFLLGEDILITIRLKKSSVKPIKINGKKYETEKIRG